MDNQYFLALDYGTQSTRALVFDPKGNLIAKAQLANANCREEQQGTAAASQSGDYCVAQLTAVVQKLLAESSVRPGQIAALSLTCQRACLVLMDESGHAQSDVFMWSDRRLAAEQLMPLPWYQRLGFGLLGLGKRIHYLRRCAKTNWLDRHKVAEAPKIGLLSGLLLSRLTDKLGDGVAYQVGYLPFDYRRRRFANAGNWRWRALNCRPQQMLPLAEATTVHGGLSAGFASLTGLPTGLPVVLAGADKACEAYAAGAGDPGLACVSLGSAATVTLGLERYTEAYRYAPAFPSLDSKQFLSEVQLERGFWLLSWLIREFGAEDCQGAKALGLSPEEYILRRIDAVTPGADGLLLSPTWAQGVIFPGPEARGAIVGWRPEHGRFHLYRAVIEGVLLTLARGLERLRKVSGTVPSLIRVTGGGSQSDVVLQMAADIFNLPVERLSVSEASGLGAAMCAAVAMGQYESLAEARLGMAKSAQRFEPDPRRVACYRVVARQHARLYPRLKPLFQTM
ncbi:FGGY-family carbohydrate kinase [Shewanella sedimentimangrovi]|uniref:FGGY-family carbohydrate kinase n=1 Tax=Shewanella sedimentimangrovi TaxID=2814293 RepID=A0ABX7R7F4_9GAMM|nr:FGGY-family carbohydrate kinase [Shewanella sedimentimangrovi]QSX38708.1 FGGY-family carbohydrate kinase [Shewanella sedimentimangrovi]